MTEKQTPIGPDEGRRIPPFTEEPDAEGGFRLPPFTEDEDAEGHSVRSGRVTEPADAGAGTGGIAPEGGMRYHPLTDDQDAETQLGPANSAWATDKPGRPSTARRSSPGRGSRACSSPWSRCVPH